MTRHLTVINLVFTAVLLFLGVRLYQGYLDIGSSSPDLPPPGEERPEETVIPADTPGMMPMPEYSIIEKKNLFHPERKPVAAKTKDMVRHEPEFVLYGTVMTDGKGLAFLEDRKAPYRTPGRGKRHLVLGLGGSISGYTVAEIYQDRVVLVRGGERVEVRVTEPKKRVASPAPKQKAAVKRAKKKKVKPEPKTSEERPTAPSRRMRQRDTGSKKIPWAGSLDRPAAP